MCVWLLTPFIPALTWATALCILASPLHDWILRKKWGSTTAAATTTAAVTLVILIPAIFVTIQLAQQASSGIQEFEQQLAREGGIAGLLRNNGTIAPVMQWMEQHVDWSRELERLRGTAQGVFSRTLGGAVWTFTNALVAVFLLFYFFRDRDQTVRLVRRLIPASDKESTHLLDQVGQMIRSTLYGTLLVAAIQGLLGGLMFWFLGIPGALLWGVAMAILSVIPVLGAFIVWAPAALFLAMQGEWMNASILTAWGVVVVGLIDNLLYPIFVGKQTQIHTVPMFLALVGGLAVFGAAGLVIGPMVLASTWELLQLLRRRSAINDETIDRPVE